METLPNTSGTLDAVLALAAKGYYCIPLTPGSKVSRVKWKQYQDAPPSEIELRHLFADARNNAAVLCGDLVVVDCDAADVEEFVVHRCGPTSYRCRTPNGGLHLGYRAPVNTAISNRVKIDGRPIDLRAAGGYAIVPPSVNADGVPYRWENEPPPLAELPMFHGEWMCETQSFVAFPPPATGGTTERIRRARTYLAKVDGAIAGNGGHNRTFRAACVLAQKFGLTYDEAWPLLAEWNLRCEPQWSLTELRHKLMDALNKAGN